MPVTELANGTVDFHVYGPDHSDHPPVLFVHGVLVDLQLWDRVAGALGAAGFRCWSVTWPLGSHRIPWGPHADRSPRGAARLIAAFIEEHGLTGVTLVGNDTGGALCQFLLAERPDLVGRLVLTNCDAFDSFPPRPFDLIFALLRHEPLIRPLTAALRVTALRHSPLGYGLLLGARDPATTASWLRPVQVGAEIRADLAAFLRAIDPADLAAVTERMREFDKPVTLVWGTDDRCFTPALGRRLAAVFPRAEFVEAPGARTFVALDRPGAVVDAVAAISGGSISGGSISGGS